MFQWFGGGAAKKNKDQAKDAIVSIRVQLETLRKQEAYLESERDKAEAQAKKLVNVNKPKALDALRRKKRREGQLEKLWGQISSMEQQLEAIESANMNRETMNVMTQGAAAMRGINKGLDIDKLDETMDEVRDQVALGNEISDAISRPLMETDDAELEEELEELEQEALDEKMVKAGRAPAAQLPELGHGEALAAEPAAEDELDEDEDAILEQLKAEMAA